MHYLSDMPDNISESMKTSIQGAFRQMIESIISSLRNQSTDHMTLMQVSYLASSLCWSYQAEDLEWLCQQNVFETLLGVSASAGTARACYSITTSILGQI